MTTRILDRFPVDVINSEAREVHPVRTLLLFLAAGLYGVGWAFAKVFAVAWLTLAWVFVAVRLGFRDGRKPAIRGD